MKIVKIFFSERVLEFSFDFKAEKQLIETNNWNLDFDFIRYNYVS